MEAAARPLKIKTGVCKRLQKELASYEREAREQEQLVSQLRLQQRDEADIRKQEEVLEETRAMIPDTQMRLEQANQALRTLVEAIESSGQTEDVKESEDWKYAITLLQL